MISIDITLFIHIINMIVLMIFLNRMLYKPVLEILNKRQEEKDKLEGTVEEFERRSKTRQMEVDRKMQTASAKAKKALDEARSKALAEGADTIAAIRKEADQEKERQLAEIKSSFDTARQELLADVEAVAQEMAAKILGRSLKA
ncbi:ATP synthase subunit b [Candidatus Electronema halotolerans]|jgi:F-type H+-transporting ATPase subunit b